MHRPPLFCSSPRACYGSPTCAFCMHAGSVPGASGHAPGDTPAVQHDPAEESASECDDDDDDGQPPLVENSDSESEEEEEAEVDSSDEEAERLEKERFAFGTKFVKTSKDNSQPVKSLEWTLVDHTKLPVNCERERAPGANGTKYPARLLNQKGAIDSIYKHWKHFCPPTWLGKFVKSANTLGYFV